MNKQDYLIVDLGLPSNTKWTDRNVGAKNPLDNGLYFSWGNVDGHIVDENGNTIDGYSFDRDTYYTTLGGQYIGSTLDSEHDAATVNMGDSWRMPTSAETRELIENTDHYYINENGEEVAESNLDGSKLRSICFVKKGEIFDYNNRTNNFIEFPFAGGCDSSSLYFKGLYGFVWSSSVNEYDAEYTRFLNFSSDDYLRGDSSSFRFYGRPVRGVTSNNN